MEVTTNFTPGTNHFTRPLERTIDQAGARAHITIDKVSDAARPAVDRLASSAHQVIDKVTSAASQAVQTLDAKGEQLNGAQARLLEAGRNCVRDNPMMALGTAIPAGFVLSRMFSSR